MLIFTLRRLLVAIPILFVASILVFLMVANSGDPLEPLKLRNPPVPQATLELREHELYLDRSIPERYWLWLTGIGDTNGDIGLLQGKFGPSVRANVDIGEELFQRAGVTMRLIFAAVILAVLLAIASGVYSAVRQYSKSDYALTFIGFLALSMPTFWFASLILGYAVQFNQATGTQFFYVIGENSPHYGDLSGVDALMDTLGHLALPTFSLMLLSYAAWSRYQRGTTLEVLNSDHVRLARSKGLRNGQVLRRHVLRNALIPLTTVTALDIGGLIGGAVITETIFGWRGLGRMLIDAVNGKDIYTVMAWLLFSGFFVILFNLIADLLYARLDPRIRLD